MVAPGILVIGLAQPARSQNPDAPKQTYEERLQALEQQLKRLQPLEEELKRLRAVEKELIALKKQREPSGAPAAQNLAQELNILKRQREVDKEEELAAAQKLKDLPTATAGKQGFALKSADGNFALKLRGVLQADGTFFLGDRDHKATDAFSLDKVRPVLEGTLFKYYDFRFMPDFGQGKTVIQDAYIDGKFLPELALRVGKFKSPVGLERLETDSDVKFTQRALPTAIVPNRDIGVDLHGEFLAGVISYDVGVVNGVADGSSGDTDENDSKDIAARLFAHPFKRTSLEPLQGLGVGIAGTIGNAQGAGPSYKSAGQQTFFSFDSDVTADGNRDRISPQAYYYWGPFGLLAEYVVSSQELRKGTGASLHRQRLQNSAWQVAVTCLLTGEKATYAGVVPDKPLDPFKGQWGAFEIAARVSELDVDDNAFRNFGTTASPNRFADPAKSASKATAWGVGLNWYLNKNIRFTTDYEQTHFQGGGVNGDRQDEKVIFGRFQLAF
jgi:phosphate-selective porin OprO/OprP